MTSIKLAVLDMAGTTVADDGLVLRAFDAAGAAAGLPATGPEAEAARRGAKVVALDYAADEVVSTRATFAAGLAAPRAAGFAAGLAAGFAAPFGAGRPPRERPLPLTGASLPVNAADSLADRPVA